MKKRVLESYPPLDMDQLIKHRKGNKIAVTAEVGLHSFKIRLDLRSLEGKVGEEYVILEKSSCGFGGYRYWFLCPQCKQRYRILYLKKSLICRKCGKLSYASQQRTKTDCYYFYQKAILVAKQLDAEYDEQRDFFKHPYLFPIKPKNMRTSTYANLKKKFNNYIDEGDRIWLEYVSWRYKK